MLDWLPFGHEKKLDKVVENLVIRARAGDQNAIATISQVSKNKSRNKKASQTFSKLKEYIRQHPVGRKSIFGKEKLSKFGLEEISKSDDPTVVIGEIVKSCRCKNGVHAACVALANGPALNALKITELASAMPDEYKETAFRFGVDFHRESLTYHIPPSFQNYAGIGQILGRARGIQVVRRGGPIAALSPELALELGDKRGFTPFQLPQVFPPLSSQAQSSSNNGSSDGGTQASPSDDNNPPMDSPNNGSIYSDEEQQVIDIRTNDDDSGPTQETVDALLSN